MKVPNPINPERARRKQQAADGKLLEPKQGKKAPAKPETNLRKAAGK